MEIIVAYLYLHPLAAMYLLTYITSDKFVKTIKYIVISFSILHCHSRKASSPLLPQINYTNYVKECYLRLNELKELNFVT